MNYTIFMLKKNDQTARKRFMSYRWNMEHGGVIIDEYVAVYNGSIEPRNSVAETLEAIYRDFNLNAQPDYYGRSLSVSDLVALEGVGTFFCDSVGFKQIEAR